MVWAEDLPCASESGAVTLIPRTTLFGNPERAHARLNPDGTKLAFLAPVDGVLNVWVGPADDLQAAKAVTKDTHRGIRSFFWAYTCQHILYTQDKDGDEDFHVLSGQEGAPGLAETLNNVPSAAKP